MRIALFLPVINILSIAKGDLVSKTLHQCAFALLFHVFNAIIRSFPKNPKQNNNTCVKQPSYQKIDPTKQRDF